MSDSVMNFFEKHILPLYFGCFAHNRVDFAANEASATIKKLHDIENNVSSIFDEAYCHGNKSNSEYKKIVFHAEEWYNYVSPFHYLYN